MKKLLSCIIVSIIVLGGLTAAVSAADQKQKDAQRSGITESPYEDELDQSMTDYDGTLPLGRTNIFGYYVNLSIAQSFIPQMEVLTRTYFLMARNTTTTHPCTLAIRDNLTKEDLTIVSVQPSEFPVVNGTPTEQQLAWMEFNFDDIWVTPGQTYYIVVYTANITDNFYWISGNGTNMYPNGTVYLSINDGQNWSEFTDADGCFKTFGLHETFWNYTAWDVVLDSTIGGLVFFGAHITMNVSEIPPGEEVILQPGLIFGFGKVTISQTISGANVKETSSEASGFLLLIFLLGIK